MSMASAGPFVSYSHADSALVEPVVRLLRVQNPSVFHDVDSIRPGKKWREEIEAAITRSSLLIVFWCRHAKNSDEVEAEWRAALALEKDLLPILLDDTPLAEELAQYQWIDFQGLVATSHQTAEGFPRPQPAPMPTPKSSHAPYWIATAAAVAAGVGIALTGLQSTDSLPSPGGEAPQTADGFQLVWIPLAVALATLLWALYRWKSARPQQPPPAPAPTATETQQEATTASDQATEAVSQMAQQIEAEVLRRIKPRR